jgi:hypothetical protein
MAGRTGISRIWQKNAKENVIAGRGRGAEQTARDAAIFMVRQR